MSTRVAVIGAGPSGLSQLHAFSTAHQKGAVIPKVVCFEKQADWGGLWNYTWRTGLDEHGEPCHGSMYRYLYTIGPKESMEFADYTFQEHFGKSIGSFPPRSAIFDYIRGRAEKSDVKKWIRFSSVVRMVDFEEQTGKFTVTVHDFAADRTYSEDFDYVVVATGHFPCPNVPHFEGIEQFTGHLLHSHDFRDASQFEGKHTLIVGDRYSAEDIASQCYKFGANSVTISYRTKAPGYKWPESIEEVLLLQYVNNGNTCHFLDGSSRPIDAIILCTGYIHNFPFLPNNLRLKTNNRFWPLDLYKGVAWFVRDVILGRITLPSKQEMKDDCLKYREKEEKLQKDIVEFALFQGNYVEELANATDYPDTDLEAAIARFKKYVADKEEDVTGYHDQCYQSLRNGEFGSAPRVKWINAKDDSLVTCLHD